MLSLLLQFSTAVLGQHVLERDIDSVGAFFRACIGFSHSKTYTIDGTERYEPDVVFNDV